MKNRPVAAQANQFKDVYGSQKSSTRTTVSAVLAVLDLILACIAVFTGNNLMMVVFIPLFVILLISFLVGKKADRVNMPPVSKDSPDSIFKDHEI